MNNPSIKKNVVLSTAYQMLLLFLPLITAPYISRVLGVDGVGIYSYTYSIQTYFAMFAALGTASYGSREIARNRDDIHKRSQLFWEIELLTVVTTSLCLIAWFLLTLFSGTYQIYYMLLSFALLATMFDISWLYTGIEQFRYIVLQNSIFKLLGAAALFLFVKEKDDVPVYVLILSLTTLLVNLSMWIYLPKFVHAVSLKNIRILPHFKETLVYFLPAVATSVYTVLDKALIGWMTDEVSENGYYEQATKIVGIAKAVTFTSLNNVIGSRMSYLFAQGRNDEAKEKIYFSIEYVLFMGFGICFGLLGVSARFVPVFFGNGYEQVITLLYELSFIVIIIGISNCLGSQYYNPAGLRALSAKFIIAGSVVNLMINLVLIPKFKSTGAVAASIIAELVITGLYLRYCNGFIRLKDIVRMGKKKLVAALGMLAVVLILDKIIVSDMPALLSEVIAGMAVYVAMLSILKDDFIKRCKGLLLQRKDGGKRHGSAD